MTQLLQPDSRETIDQQHFREIYKQRFQRETIYQAQSFQKICQELFKRATISQQSFQEIDLASFGVTQIYQQLSEAEKKLNRKFTENECVVVLEWLEWHGKRRRNREEDGEGDSLQRQGKEDEMLLNLKLCCIFTTEELACFLNCFVKQEPQATEGEKNDGKKASAWSKIQLEYGRLKLAYIISVAVVVIALVTIVIFKTRDSRTQPELLTHQFSKSFAQVKDDFPGQKPRFWSTLQRRATAHLKNPNPKKPLVIMFTAGPSAHNVLECITRKLAQTLPEPDHNGQGHVLKSIARNLALTVEPDHNGLGHINSTEYHKYSSLDDAKKNLDEKLMELLQKGRALMVSNVDQLPLECLLLFYEYCDNENAPFKQAAIFFTVRLPLDPDPDLEPARAEGLVEKYLRKTWGEQDHIRPDDIPPLVNRMTDTVVVMVKEESDETIERNCEDKMHSNTQNNVT